MEFLLPTIYNQNSHPHRSGYRTTKIKQTTTGFVINRFSHYISLQKIKLVYNDKGFSKGTVKVDTNYRPKYQYTLYFDNLGNIIKADTTLQERKIWLELQQ